MGFKPLSFTAFSNDTIVDRSNKLLDHMKSRRSVRDFSNQKIPTGVIENAVKVAVSAPSGANKQPWHFVIVRDPFIKKEIRIAAEEEEKAFYGHRAPESWLKDLNQFETTWEKPFLEQAPALVVVFKESYSFKGSNKRKNYYVNESVGIAAGFLLSALHYSGLVTLTHTPSPMGFLEKILKRPINEKAVLLIPVGFPKPNADVPQLRKKKFENVVSIV